MYNLIQRFIQTMIFAFLLLKICSCKPDKVEVPEPKPPKPPCVMCSDFDHYAVDYDPAWSYDGGHIAYFHADKELSKTGLYVITPEGNDNKLWHQGILLGSPSWSPDGQWIVFSHGSQIWKKKINGDSLTSLTSSGRNFYPSWSPDGKWIAYDSDVDSPTGLKFIWKMHPDGSDKTRIGYDPDKGEIRAPYWGRNNLISHIRYIGNGGGEIFLMDGEGGSVKQLTNDAHSDYDPRISSKNMIIFKRLVDGETPKMWLIDGYGNNPKQLTDQTGEVSDWSPDGNRIVYTYAVRANGRLWIMNADGTKSLQLTFEYQF